MKSMPVNKAPIQEYYCMCTYLHYTFGGGVSFLETIHTYIFSPLEINSSRAKNSIFSSLEYYEPIVMITLYNLCIYAKIFIVFLMKYDIYNYKCKIIILVFISS